MSIDSPSPLVGAPVAPRSADSRVAEISSLLSALEAAAAETGLAVDKSKRTASAAPTIEQHENRLVQVRLGIASSLFAGLRHRHPPTASHSLRVALGCSSWALHKKLEEKTRDAVELAALMHDIGVIGAPDAVLFQSASQTNEQSAAASRATEIAIDVLKHCCSSKRVLDAVRYAAERFDGENGSGELAGEKLPLESRMIAIVNAFDEWTTGGPRGRAASRDEAFKLLREQAGKELDPILVEQFIDLLSQQKDDLTAQIASRWLSELARAGTELPWHLQPPNADDNVEVAKATADPAGGRPLFGRTLLDAMHDGVVFVDAQARIFMWSKGAERLTGVSEVAAEGRKFAPSLLDMCNGAGRLVGDDACPLARALETSTQLRQRLQILGRQGRHVAVDLHAIPVYGANGSVQGATVLLHDAQPEASLEQKCEALHAEVTKDPMTKVANRAEFDRMQALFIEAHQQAQQPCSLIMTDIDHFKTINDTYGHQAGDEAIITVANLLTSMCRSGDLVARYGGEEFALLCADCDGEEAADRAEQIRRQLSETAHSYLGNRRLTASFGVTDLQEGDSPESMLRRADNALLMAKEQGRNQVVQLGDAMPDSQRKKFWWSFGSFRAKPLIETSVATGVPMDIAIEKLKGFIADLSAKVVKTKEDYIEMEITSDNVGQQRRRGDRNVRFRVEVSFSETRESRSNSLGFARGEYVQTEAKVVIRPKRSRDRRAAERSERARLILQSFKAYLMAKEHNEETPMQSQTLQEAEA